MISIQQYKTDIGFRTLVEGVNDGLYVIPKYQRKFRWKKDQIESLIESLIKCYPIPPIYTIRNAENQLEIIDGQQRVLSLFFFYIGSFLNTRKKTIDFSSLETGNKTLEEALNSVFDLEELTSEIDMGDGNTKPANYRKLGEKDRRRVDYSTIAVVEIKIDNPNKKEEILRTIFANLNKRGTQLSDQEQRNGIFGCRFYDMLQGFNRNNVKWRAIWGKEAQDERDMQALLRFCALKEYVTIDINGNYTIKSSERMYKDMLDKFSEEAMEYDENKIKNCENSLNRFVNCFETSIKLSRKIALLESLYVVEEINCLNKKITDDRIKLILKLDLYKRNSQQGTAKMKYMNERWKAVYGILSGYDN